MEERFVEKLKKDKGLSKDLKAVLNKLSNINGLTPYPPYTVINSCAEPA